jgi:hypothetical protein
LHQGIEEGALNQEEILAALQIAKTKPNPIREIDQASRIEFHPI